MGMENVLTNPLRQDLLRHLGQCHRDLLLPAITLDAEGRGLARPERPVLFPKLFFVGLIVRDPVE